MRRATRTATDRRVMDKPFEAYRGTEPYLFVSYAHADAAPVYAEIDRLHRLGYRIWYDEGIDPATIWDDVIHDRLKNAAAVLAFLSPSIASSKWVPREIKLADELGKPLVAVHLAKTTLPGGIAIRIAEIQALYRYELEDGEFLRRLERALSPHGLVGTATDRARALVAKGQDSHARGEYDRAIACFSDAIALDPLGASVYRHRGRSRFRIKAYDESLADYRKAHELEPSVPIPTVFHSYRFRFVRFISRIALAAKGGFLRGTRRPKRSD